MPLSNRDFAPIILDRVISRGLLWFALRQLAHHPDSDHSQAWFVGGEIAPSRLAHIMATAEVIVQTLVAAHAAKT